MQYAFQINYTGEETDLVVVLDVEMCLYHNQCCLSYIQSLIVIYNH